MLFRKITFVAIAILCLSYITASAQADSINLGKGVKTKLYGFVRGDYLFDSRQNAGIIDGLFAFYPLPELPDANGDDLNAVATSSLYALSTRFGAALSGPNALNAKTSGCLEFDFTGTAGTGGVRLRQAWIKLDWGSTDFLVGRTWHPMTLAAMPMVVSLGTGAPFAAFNRSEQVRFNYRFSHIQLSLTGLFRSTEYMRTSLVPEVNAMFTYANNGFSVGASADYMNIRPKTATQANGNTYKTNERVNAISAQVFFNMQKKNFALKASSIYGEMLNDLFMMGGYAVYDIDPTTGAEKYVPSKHINTWVSATYGQAWKVGLMLGYLKNLGYSETPISTVGRGMNVDYMYRISPSLTYNLPRLQLGCELEYTSAAYGLIDMSGKGKVLDSSPVNNIRVNLAAIFYF